MCKLFLTRYNLFAAGFRDLLTVTLADVVDGTYDLRIPRLVALVISITPSASGDWVLELQVLLTIFQVTWVFLARFDYHSSPSRRTLPEV